MGKEMVVRTSGKEGISDAVSILSKAFENDPVITYMLYRMSDEKRIGYLPAYFNALITAASMNNAIISDIESWKTCGVLMPPGCRVDNPWTLLPAGFIPMLWNIGFGGCKRMLGEFTPLTDKAKMKGLKGEHRYYYVFFIATEKEARGNGYAMAMIRHWQELATRDQVPLWLEATTEHSMKIYYSLGFEIIEEIVLGKGIVEENGRKCKGGAGVKIWGMVWRPKVIDPSQTATLS